MKGASWPPPERKTTLIVLTLRRNLQRLSFRLCLLLPTLFGIIFDSMKCSSVEFVSFVVVCGLPALAVLNEWGMERVTSVRIRHRPAYRHTKFIHFLKRGEISQ